MKTSSPFLILRSRVGLIAAVSLLALPVLSTESRADPAVVDYDGVNYDVYVAPDTSYSGLTADELADQPWLNNSAEAQFFAAAVANQLGDSNYAQEGPFFVVSTSDGSFDADFYDDIGDFGTNGSSVPQGGDVSQYEDLGDGFGAAYAYAEPVQASVPDSQSTPVLMLIVLTALGFAKRRLKPVVA